MIQEWESVAIVVVHNHLDYLLPIPVHSPFEINDVISTSDFAKNNQQDEASS